MPFLGSNLGPKVIKGSMHSALASLLKGYWHTRYLCLFMMGYNKHNIYVLLYGTQVYSGSSTCQKLVNQIEAFVRLLIFVVFFIHWYFFTYSIMVEFTIFFVIFIYL